MDAVIARGRRRMRGWPKKKSLLIAGAVTLALVAAIAPLRFAASRAGSHVIAVLASPFAPDVSGFDALPQTSSVVAADGTELATIGDEQRMTVPLEEIPTHVREAVLAAEDTDFYQHAGVSPSAIVRAVLNNLGGNDIQGGSTITQQLAKINYAGRERTVFRKVRELLYAVTLERKHSKDTLLQRYLNQVYFGQGAYGVGMASEAFFGIPPDQLTLDQAAILAGKIRSPEKLDPTTDPDAVRARRDAVLRTMERHGFIAAAEHAAAREADIAVTGQGVAADAGIRAPHFVRFVKREAETLAALGGDPTGRLTRLYHTGGYRIETTLSPTAQDAALAAVRETLGEPGDPATAVVSVQPGDGAIRALVSGLDPTVEFDVATQGRRQPGSSFKPYVYMAMLENGVDPRSVFDSDSPMTLDCRGEPWEVHNYEGRGHGRISADDALVGSVNVVYAQLIRQLGTENVRAVAERAGVPREALDPPVCAMALGGLREGVSVLEQAAGYATFAAGGTYAAPYSIVRVVDRSGEVLFEREPETRKAFEPKRVGVLTAALQRVVEQGTGRAARFGRPVAGKTGTSDDYANAWFAGYTPQLATAVWVGHPDADTPMTDVRGRRVTGGSFPAQVFARTMREALRGQPVRPLITASPDELELNILGATPSPSPSPTPSPTPSMTPKPTPKPTPRLTATPVWRRTAEPTSKPTAKPRPTTRPKATPTPEAEQSSSTSSGTKTAPTPTPTPSSDG